jgi:hypothetical protein
MWFNERTGVAFAVTLVTTKSELESPMDMTLSQLLIAFAGVAVFTLIAIETWLFFKRQQARNLKQLDQSFGRECSRIVDTLESQATTQLNVVVPVKRLKIVRLAPAEAARFGYAWIALQNRFESNPKGVVSEADHLVHELMMKLGYPVADFEDRAAEISVDHASIVANYHAAQSIAVRDAHGHADTEARRKAMVYYRALFDELLGGTKTAPEVVLEELMEIQ